MIKKFLSTNQQSWSLLISRLALGAVMLPHGMQKALGAFGGYGFNGTIGFMHGQMGLPIVLAALVIAAEFLGSLGVIFGVATRFMAFSIALTLSGAMFLGGHIHNGFFMNWFGNQPGEGIEFFILALGLAIALLIGGSGRFSVDNWVSGKLK
jgi:putative oxidoreductase